MILKQTLSKEGFHRHKYKGRRPRKSRVGRWESHRIFREQDTVLLNWNADYNQERSKNKVHTQHSLKCELVNLVSKGDSLNGL